MAELEKKAHSGESRGAREFTEETVAYAAELAKLTLTAEEREQARKDFSEILGYVERMNELDTDGIGAAPFPVPVRNVFREDIVTNAEDRENLLANAPGRSGDFFRAPKTVEQA